MYKIMCMYCSHVYISRYGFSPDRPLKLERHSPKSVCSLLSSELLEFRQLLIAVQLILHSNDLRKRRHHQKSTKINKNKWF